MAGRRAGLPYHGVERRVDALHDEMREMRHDLGAGINTVLERIADMVGVLDEKYKDLLAAMPRAS